MNAFQKQIQGQVAKLPGGLVLDFDSLTKTCSVQMKFLVYVDYHKRRGLKLSSSVYEFQDGIADGEILQFLKSEGKSKKKGGAKIEWGGESEVFYMQDYPKDIIQEDKLQQLGQAIFGFQHDLFSVRKRMMMIKRDADMIRFDEADIEENAFFHQALAGGPQMIKEPSGNRMNPVSISSGKAESFAEESSVTNSIANSVSTNGRWFARKNKKQSAEFVELDDAGSDSDSAGLLVH